MEAIKSWDQVVSLLTELTHQLDELRANGIMVSIEHCGIKDVEGGYGWHCLFRIKAVLVFQQCAKCGYAPKVHGHQEEIYLENRTLTPLTHRHSWRNKELVILDTFVTRDHEFVEAIDSVCNKVKNFRPSIFHHIPQGEV